MRWSRRLTILGLFTAIITDTCSNKWTKHNDDDDDVGDDDDDDDEICASI